jgi:signal transduction histidine kinase
LRFLRLAESPHLSESQRLEYIAKSKQGMERMAEMLKSVLSFSEGLFSETQRVSVNTLIQKTIFLMTQQIRTSKISVKTFYDKRIPLLILPAVELALQNLIKNACDAMPDGGLLVVATQKLDQGLKIFIRDSGGGISTEYQRKIFEPFFTTKRDEGGLGLGLPVAKEIIERSRGYLTMINQEGEGMTCAVYLPFERS